MLLLVSLDLRFFGVLRGTRDGEDESGGERYGGRKHGRTGGVPGQRIIEEEQETDMGRPYTSKNTQLTCSLLGIVRAPLFTTLMQVASRILLIWGIVHPFPNTVAFSPVYSSMLIAWSVTEVIRYSYFAINLSTGSVPALWLWLRYNTFFVLYPLGISSECWLVWLAATGPAKQYTGVREGLFAILLIYVPGKLLTYSCAFWARRD